MPRPRKAMRPVQQLISLPEDLHAEIKLMLFSELEGRVPQGALSSFFELAAREKLSRIKAKLITNQAKEATSNEKQ